MQEKLHKIYPYSIFLLFLFPLLKESKASLVFIVFSTLTLAVFVVDRPKFSLNKTWIYLTIPFWIILLYSVATLSITENLKHIKHALFILLFPAAFALSPQSYFTTSRITMYFKILCAACILLGIAYLTLFLMTNPVVNFFLTRNNSSFFRDFVYGESSYFSVHPAYYSSVMVFCSAFCLQGLQKKWNWFYAICLPFFYIMTLLLLTKLNIVLLTATWIIFLLFFARFKIVFKIMIVAGILLALYWAILNVPGLQLRLSEAINSVFTTPAGAAHDSTNVRVAILECNQHLIKDHFLSGMGFSNIGLGLKECFAANYNSTFFVDELYLTHNYFIYILLGSGVTGLVLMGFFFFNIIALTLRMPSFPLFILVGNTIAMCMIEDYFYRQNGVYFFMLVFLSYYKNSELKSTE